MTPPAYGTKPEEKTSPAPLLSPAISRGQIGAFSPSSTDSRPQAEASCSCCLAQAGEAPPQWLLVGCPSQEQGFISDPAHPKAQKQAQDAAC